MWSLDVKRFDWKTKYNTFLSHCQIKSIFSLYGLRALSHVKFRPEKFSISTQGKKNCFHTLVSILGKTNIFLLLVTPGWNHICKDLRHILQNCLTEKACFVCSYRIILKLWRYRSSCPELFLEKGVLKICRKFTGEHPCRRVISIELLCFAEHIFLRTPLNGKKYFLKNFELYILINLIKRSVWTWFNWFN